MPIEEQEKIRKWHAEERRKWNAEERRKWNAEERRKWPFGRGAEMVMWDEVDDGMEVRTP